MPTKCYEIKNLGLKTNFETRKYSRIRHSLDKEIVDRVRLYVLENQSKRFIDANDLVDALRQKYPVYMRRKKTAIKYIAGRAIAKLAEEKFDSAADQEMSVEPIASDSDVRSNLSNISSDDELSTTNNTTLNMSDSVHKASHSIASQDDEEFINISSEENIDEASSSCSTITLDDDQVKTADKDAAVQNPKKRKLNETSDSIDSSCNLSSTVCNNIGDVKSDKSALSKSILERKKEKSKLRHQNGKLKSDSLKVGKSAVPESEPATSNVPSLTLKDFAGSPHVVSDVVRLMIHFYHPEIYNHMRIDPPRGFLLHGPPGCGKTLLAQAVAGELRIPLIEVAAPELVAGVSGISELRIRKLFEKAVKLSPCVLFIDEIDSITQNRDVANRDMERRIVSQLLSSLDKLNRDPKASQVLVIGATNRPDSLDPALRRAGRFDREVCIGLPNKESRYDILRLICSKLRLADDVCLREIASYTPGYVGADLHSLVHGSVLSAVERTMEKILNEEISINKNSECTSIGASASNGLVNNESTLNNLATLSWIRNRSPIKREHLETLCISKEDFKSSLKRVQPSSKREGFVTVPNVTWDDVGSLGDVRKALQMAILAPVKYPKHFADVGLPASMGVLLCGPPGCGKTLLAKAVANEAGINFISVKGPELLNMYVGGSEKAVRECFHRAKNSQPCVIFFDELDALCPKRSDHSENSAGMRVVNQLLTEMDGVEGRSGVFLMAATNRPDIIDPAVLRPGRLDKILYVGFPNEVDRIDILCALTKNGTKPRLHEDVNLTELAKNPLCDGFTGADLAALVRDASMLALSDIILSGKSDDDCAPVIVAAKHFQQALENLRPSVSEIDRKHYEHLRLKFATSTYQLRVKQELTN